MSEFDPVLPRRPDRDHARGDGDRRRRHGRHRRVHQPRLPGPGHPLGLRSAAALDRRRRRRAVRRALLRRARGGVAALERRVQLPVPHLSSGRRLPGRLGVGDRRLCRAGGARRHGVRRVLRRRPARRCRRCCSGSPSIWLVSLRASLAASRHGSTFQNRLDGAQAGADPRLRSSPASRSASRSRSRSRRRRRDLGYIISAPFAISLVFVMYSYSGWNAATYIAGEMRDPQRSLPRALFLRHRDRDRRSTSPSTPCSSTPRRSRAWPASSTSP